MIKTYLKSYLYLFILITIMTIILSIINYFIPKNMEIFKIIIPVIAMLIAAINLGKRVKNKAYLEGIKFSGILNSFLVISPSNNLIHRLSTPRFVASSIICVVTIDASIS